LPRLLTRRGGCGLAARELVSVVASESALRPIDVLSGLGAGFVSVNVVLKLVASGY
jgi:hypothetical protein